MPKLGMTMTEGVIVRWHVNEGDVVAKDDVLAEVETDKVELEVEAPFAGTVLRIVAPAGQPIPVGESILLLETSAGSSVPLSTQAPAPSAVTPGSNGATAPAQQPTSETPSVAQATAIAGDRRVPSTPAAKRIARERGVELADVRAAVTGSTPGQPVRATDVLAYQTPGANTASITTQPSPAQPQPLLTPLARKVIEAQNVAVSDLPAMAQNGRRLTKQEVEAAISDRAGTAVNGRVETSAAPTNEAASRSASPPAGGTASAEDDTDIAPLTSMRRVIAERTTRSFTTTPHIYLDIEVDMAEAEALRQAHATAAGRRGDPAPSATAILVRVVATALAKHPEVNAGFMPASEGSPAGVRRWRSVNVGVAVALPDGLLVPVVRDADKKPLAALSGEIATLARKARDGQLKPDDLTGASFTISNLGMYGIDTFHAVINEPQSAILAVGRIAKRATVIDDKAGGETIAIRPILKLSLSADHRVLDGATGARFLATLRELLEDPRLLL